VLNAQGLAELVELVRATRLTVPGAKQPLGELLAIIASLKLRLRLVFGQKLGDLDRAGLALRKARAKAALLLGWIAMYTQRVARSMATKR